ncbi:MAG: mannose-1-phosphate guanylyltransferase [Clostridia bacterium]|nr:mannose-1-phosphate guanylyltransferase [Clostridia bacterium]
MKTAVLIMAGGHGERFWPRSRKNLPKQFLNITDKEKTMIRLTVERILPLVNIEDVYILTNKDYFGLVKEQLPDLPEANIICEPVSRNTAPCIGLGAMYVSKKDTDAVMFVLPSDHLIKNTEEFLKILKNAKEIAESGENLVTIGITPNYPETGYGYIKYLKDMNNGSFSVDKFVEKPNIDKAKEYLADGKYLWNSGMFIFTASTILKNMEKFMPDTFNKLSKIKEVIGTEKEQEVLYEEFQKIEKQSIDYGIMEKASNIFTIPGSFGWDDVGSWVGLGRINEKDENDNVLLGNTVTVNTNGCIICGNKRLIATLNVKDLVIVDTEDAILISDKNSTNNIKEIINKVKESSGEKYL